MLAYDLINMSRKMSVLKKKNIKKYVPIINNTTNIKGILRGIAHNFQLQVYFFSNQR